MTKWPLILAVLFACVQIAPVMLIFSFLIGVAHFGFVSGPQLTLLKWLSYFILTVPAISIFSGYRLRAVVKKHTSYHLNLFQSIVIVLPAILAIHASEAIITLYQIGDDTIIFIIGLLYALISTVSLAYLFTHFSKVKLAIVLIIQLFFIVKVITWFSPESLFRQAEEYFKNEMYWDARNTYEFVIEKYPGFTAKNPIIKTHLEDSKEFLEKEHQQWLDLMNQKLDKSIPN